MRQTKYASAVPKNLGLGFDFRPCSGGDFLTGRPYLVRVLKQVTATSLSTKKEGPKYQ